MLLSQDILLLVNHGYLTKFVFLICLESCTIGYHIQATIL